MERLKHYFVANAVTDADQKASILLIVSSHIQSAIYIRSLVPDNKLEGVAFDTLVGLYSNNYNTSATGLFLMKTHRAHGK